MLYSRLHISTYNKKEREQKKKYTPHLRIIITFAQENKLRNEPDDGDLYKARKGNVDKKRSTTTTA